MAKSTKASRILVSMAEQKAERIATVADITAEIRDGFDTFFAGGDMVKAARDAATKAGEEHGLASGKTKVAIFVRLAGTAHRNNWKLPQIEEALTAVRASMANRPKITVASFANDLKRVLHPDWRAKIGDMFTLADAAYKADKAAMQRVKKNAYHYVMNHLLPAYNAKGEIERSAGELAETADKAVKLAKALPEPVETPIAPMEAIGEALEILNAVQSRAPTSAVQAAIASLSALSANSFGKDHPAAMDEERKTQAKARANGATAPAPAKELPVVNDDILAALTGQMTQMAAAIAALKTR